jgi:hypothetical protein
MFDSLQDELFEAIGNEDIGACQAALDKGADVSLALPMRDTPLVAAVRNDSLEVCRWLIEAGAYANFRNGPQTWTPLFHASSANVCHLLVASGADAGALDASGHIPLHYVARNGDLGACRELLDLGSDVMAVSDQSHTVLHGALWAGRSRNGVDVDLVSLCRFFIEQGLSSSFVPPAPSRDYLTPFQYAVKHGYADVVALFCDECNEDPGQLTVAGRTMRQLASADWKMKGLLMQRSIEYAAKAGVGGLAEKDGSNTASRHSGFSPL